jgi:hypothetical protein
MTPREKVCYGCGEKAPRQPGNSSSGWSTFLLVAFFGSVALTAGSLVFSDYTPPFTGCLTGSVILLFLWRASDQFTGVKQ